MKNEELKKVIQSLPSNPGVYKYFDTEGLLIYIGKAKNLKKRVSSYFNKQLFENHKTSVMVSRINRVEYTIVDSEIDALLLENSLIKEFQPRYNVNLKDDKSYPFICIKNERFPRIYPTRNPVKDGSEYFGPYASVRMMHTILDLIRALYPTRNCNLNLTQENIASGKFKVCLEYQIGNCRGPCENLQSEEDYNQSIRHIKSILRGNINEVISYLKQLMKASADAYKFEEAERFRKRLEILETYQSRSTIVSQTIHNVDVFSIADDPKQAFINYLKVANGMIIQTLTIEYKKKLDETPQELLELAIAEIRERYHSTSKEIIVPFEMEISGADLNFVIPRAGEKKKLLDLSEKNAHTYKMERMEQYEKLNPDLRIERVLKQMQQDLRLTEMPYHIECFDNSNIQGAYPVSAMVVFKNAKPSKKDYRHYNIRTVEGPDDFATMEEVLSRRYGRLITEGQTLPQLIIIDGGKGQLGVAVDVLKKLDLYGKVAVLGIAKRLEELYFPGDQLPLYIDKRSETLRIIQQLRDEAHRFGITHHRQRRNKGTLHSELDDIKGIGNSTKELLLKELKSIKKIKEAAPEEIERIIGKSRARLIADYLGRGNAPPEVSENQ
jgi:excinuclease ABC subunit C